MKTLGLFTSTLALAASLPLVGFGQLACTPNLLNPVNNGDSVTIDLADAGLGTGEITAAYVLPVGAVLDTISGCSTPYSETIEFTVVESASVDFNGFLVSADITGVRVNGINNQPLGTTLSIVAGTNAGGTSVAVGGTIADVGGDGYGPFGCATITGTMTNCPDSAIFTDVDGNPIAGPPGYISVDVQVTVITNVLGLSLDETIPFLVYVNCDGGCLPASRNNNAAQELQVRVFPNPAADATQLRFHLPEAADVSLSVLDLTGRVVRELPAQRLTPGPQRLEVGLDGLPAGVYHVRVQTPGAVATVPVVRQ